MKNILLLTKLAAIDSRFTYKLTIVTNDKFSYSYNSKRKNRSLFYTFTKKHLIHKLTKLSKLYNQRKEDEFLCLGSFEYRNSDRLIHFHYIFSHIANNVIKEYKTMLARWKKDNRIYSFNLEPYIPHKEFIKDNPNSLSFISYILKEGDNPLFPFPFYSQDLTNLLNYENTK